MRKRLKGDRAERQRDDRVEDAPQERRGNERVVGGAAQLDEHGDEDRVDDSQAAPGDREHRPGPERDREGGEGVGRGELGARDADEAERGEQDQVGEEEVGRDPDRPQRPALAQDGERARYGARAALPAPSSIGSRLSFTRIQESGRCGFAPIQRAERSPRRKK